MAENAQRTFIERVTRRLQALPRPGRLSLVLLIIGGLLSLMCCALFGAMLVNDYKIDRRMGTAVAEVQSVTFGRTAVRYNSPDGAVHSPPGGVLYPTGLTAGQYVKVEYDQAAPDQLARVAGRTAWIGAWPILALFAGTWVVLVPSIRYIERRRSSRE